MTHKALRETPSDGYVDDMRQVSYADIREALGTGPYTMELAEEDAKLVVDAVNQGIDAHLEACFVADRGDSYEVMGKADSLGQKRLACSVSSESLPVLVRRLFTLGEAGFGLAASILQTLNLEIV